MKVELTNYDKFYLSGGFGYDVKWGRDFLLRRTQLAKGSGTLLDVGCGDGFWSHLLSEWYDVTAEDPSLGGVMMGAARGNEKVTFYHRGHTDSSTVCDVIFCRAMSQLSREIDDVFRDTLECLLSRTRRQFIYIAYTELPFNLRHPTSQYLHNPEDIQRCFSLYGTAETSFEDNYFVSTIDL
jgi:SAM-dependent methyltransferase